MRIDETMRKLVGAGYRKAPCNNTAWVDKVFAETLKIDHDVASRAI